MNDEPHSESLVCKCGHGKMAHNYSVNECAVTNCSCQAFDLQPGPSLYPDQVRTKKYHEMWQLQLIHPATVTEKGFFCSKCGEKIVSTYPKVNGVEVSGDNRPNLP